MPPAQAKRFCEIQAKALDNPANGGRTVGEAVVPAYNDRQLL
ncbi:MAG: hypothetical protein ACREGF_01085 [Candidatus Saccharimonadales bacterium]